MLRFLYVGNHAGYFLSHRLPVMLALQKAGYEVHVAVPTELDDLARMVSQNAIKNIQDLGFHVHAIPMRRGSVGLGTEFRVIMSLYKLYISLKPDIIYHATLKPVLYGGLIARLTSQGPVINAITGLGYTFIGSNIKIRLLRKLLGIAFRFVFMHRSSFALFQNRDDQDLFVNRHWVDPARTVVIRGSGVDIYKFQPTPEPDGDPVIVLPSRLLWDKGVWEFVEAARIIRQKQKAVRFVLVGDTDTENPRSIKLEQIQAWHNEGVIEWWGWKQDISSVLAKANIVCLPSYREGLPKALIEACAAGRVIVTTDVPGCREVVRDGENGLLVTVKSVTQLVTALHTLLEQPHLRQAMGRCGRDMALQSFSTDVIVGETLKLITDIRATSSRKN